MKSVATDEQLLQQLGYKQALQRTWGTFTTVTIAVSGLSVLTSMSASFSMGLTYGGPAVCVWGWIGVSLCMLCVALGMAELTSAYPTSGGMYYCMFKLSSKRSGPLACWIVGWLSLLGQVADVSAVAYLCAQMMSTAASMTSIAGGGGPVTLSSAQELGIYGGCLFLSALLNSCGMRVLSLCTQLGGILHLAGAALLALMVPLMAVQHQPASWVFGHFERAPAEAVGITNPFNIAILGLLLPAYSYTGLEGPCHMSEEVAGASRGIPKAILAGWAVTFVGGLGLIISLLFSISDIAAVLNVAAAGGGNAVAQIMYEASMQRFGGPQAAIVLWVVILLCVFFCCVATMTYVSRTLFCYSRDRAVPFSSAWVYVDRRTETPTLAVWAVTVAAFCLALPMLGSVTAFNAIVSLSTVCLNVMYVLPITARCTWGRHYFKPGPFHLGVWAYPLGAASTLWMLFSTVVFCLPTELPTTAHNLNYASVAFTGTVLFSLVMFFFPKYGAYTWFKGPTHTVDEFLPACDGLSRCDSSVDQVVVITVSDSVDNLGKDLQALK